MVIRSYDFGEADRVIVLLTRSHGLVRAVAKGVRRAKSRFGSRLQPFVNLDVQLYPGRNLYTISQADTVDFFGAAVSVTMSAILPPAPHLNLPSAWPSQILTKTRSFIMRWSPRYSACSTTIRS